MTLIVLGRSGRARPGSDRDAPPARPGGRGRRLAVLGDSRLQAMARGAWPQDGVMVLSIGMRAAVEQPSVTWDEAIVDGPTLRLLRRERPELLLSAPVHVLDPEGGLDGARQLLARPVTRAGAAFKRALDLTVALLLGLVTLPLVLLAGLAVVLDSPGPALFRQTRVGRGGVPFTLLKLRTMHENNDDAEHRAYCQALLEGTAPAYQGVYKLVADPRVTRVGTVLRRFSIDELPQLWNVLRGQMSVVGPRPCLPTDLASFEAAHWARLRVRPGLTGPWQVGGRCRLSYEQMLRCDVDYWKQWTPMTDIRILLRTPGAVLRGSGSA